TDPPATERGDPGAEPSARRGALGVVVARQRGRERAVAVAGRDGAQQVLVPIVRRHHAHRDRHPGRLLPLTREVSGSGLSHQMRQDRTRSARDLQEAWWLWGEAGGEVSGGTGSAGTRPGSGGGASTWQVTSPVKSRKRRRPDHRSAGVLMH